MFRRPENGVSAGFRCRDLNGYAIIWLKCFSSQIKLVIEYFLVPKTVSQRGFDAETCDTRIYLSEPRCLLSLQIFYQ